MEVGVKQFRTLRNDCLSVCLSGVWSLPVCLSVRLSTPGSINRLFADFFQEFWEVFGGYLGGYRGSFWGHFGGYRGSIWDRFRGQRDYLTTLCIVYSTTTVYTPDFLNKIHVKFDQGLDFLINPSDFHINP